MSVAGESALVAVRGRAWYPLVLSLLWTLAASAFFIAFPGVDIWFTGLFHQPGAGFPLADNAFLSAFREFGQALTTLIGIAAIATLLAFLVWRQTRGPLPASAAAFLLSTFVVGPGILVNVVLKDHWGRPRPYSVDLFGGTQPFVDAWQMADYCHSNCSFVAGEGSSSAWLIALALVAPPAWRGRALAVAAVLAVLLSLNRIAFGAHFLSDVTIAWGLTLVIVTAAYRLIRPRPIDLAAFGEASDPLFGEVEGFGRTAGRITIAAVAVIAGFAIFGQSTWKPAGDTHEIVEWAGLILIATASFGLVRYALARRRNPDAAVPAGAVDLLRVWGAIGVGAQFGSIAFALGVGAAVLAAFAIRLPGTAATDGSNLPRARPTTLAGAVTLACLLFLAVPLAEGIEHLQMSGLLHVLVRLP